MYNLYALQEHGLLRVVLPLKKAQGVQPTVIPVGSSSSDDDFVAVEDHDDAAAA